MDLDGNGGKQFRVLKCDGDIAEVINIDSNISTRFGTNNTYNGSDLDVALNTTYYNTLSTEAKAAIVPKDIIQYDYSKATLTDTTIGWGWVDPLTEATKEQVGERFIYALGINDIKEYFSPKETPSLEDMSTLFSSNSSFSWLNSGDADSTNYGWVVQGSYIEGSAYSEHDTKVAYFQAYACPAFQIDLSKISYTRS